MTMKFNWGTGIALVYIGFAIGMGTLVYLCVRQNIELVRDDYYTQEIHYQQRIDQKANTVALTQRLEINYDRRNALVTMDFPMELTNTSTVALHLYRPDNGTLDKAMTQALHDNVATVSTKGLKAGLWHLEMSWSCDGKDYFQETVLNL